MFKLEEKIISDMTFFQNMSAIRKKYCLYKGKGKGNGKGKGKKSIK